MSRDPHITGSATVMPRRFYTPDKFGPLCAAGCGWRIPLALSNAGINTHPTCGPAKPRPRSKRR